MAKTYISGLQLKAELCDNAICPDAGDDQSPFHPMLPGPDHGSGYNGISRLWIDQEDQNPFVPGFSGFNCEALFDASGCSFESRWMGGEPEGEAAPSRIETLSPSSARIVIEPGKRFVVRCETVFSIEEPGAVDVSMEVTPFRADYEGGYLGVLWTNDISHPADRQAYLPLRDSKTGQIQWKGCFEDNIPGPRVFQADELPHSFPPPKEKEKAPSAFYNVSKDSCVCPVFFGRLTQHLFAVMLDPPDTVRLAFDPKGGEVSPSWDFQTLIPSPIPKQTYRFRARLIFGPLALSRSLLEKYRAWSGSDMTPFIPPVPRDLTERMRRLV